MSVRPDHPTMETLASQIDAGVPASWTWKPTTRFEIDLTIGNERMVVEIEGEERRVVAESLIRLASAVHPADQRAVFHMRCCENGYFEESHVCQKQPESTGQPTILKVTWADAAIETALAVLLDYRDGNLRDAPERSSNTVAIAIDTLRAVLGGDQ